MTSARNYDYRGWPVQKVGFFSIFGITRENPSLFMKKDSIENKSQEKNSGYKARANLPGPGRTDPAGYENK